MTESDTSMPPQEDGAKANRSMSSQAILVSLLSIGGILTNILINVGIAYLYGTSVERDAYLLASVIPLYVASVFSGNLSLLFVPIFIQRRARDPRLAWKTASSIVTWSGIALCALSLLVWLFAHEISSQLSGASHDTTRLTESLLPYLLPSTLFSSLASLLGSLHYAERRFLLPSLAPILAGITTLVVAVSLNSRIGIHALAAGTSLGAVVSFLVLGYGLVSRSRLRIRPTLRDVHIWEVVRASLPLVLASLLYRFNPGFERIIGSSLPPGSISFVAYASQIILVLATVTATGITTTIFPLLAEGWATQDLTSVRRLFGIAIRSILLVSLPVAVFVAVFPEPLVRLLLQRGAFDASDTAAVASCVMWLLVGFVAANIGNVVTRCLYVAQRTYALAAYTVVETAFYVGLAVTLSGWMSYTGLAAATSIRDLVSVCIYLWMASSLFGGLNGRSLIADVTKIALAAAMMALMLTATRIALGGRLHYLVAPVGGGAVGLLLYGLLAVRLFRIEEAGRIASMLARKVSSIHRIFAHALKPDTK